MINLRRFKLLHVLVSVALSLFLCSSAVYAAEPAPAPKPQPAPQKAVTPTPPPPPPVKAAPAPPRPRPGAHGGSSSFFFDDADVFEVIQTVFGEALRVNYIIDPSIKGRVNFRTTTPIPRDRILSVIEIILRLNGIAVIEEAGLYRIIPIGNISKEPAPIRFGKAPETVELRGTALMQIVPLTFISSAEMTAILTPLLTQGGAIHDITKRNILIIADTDANVRRLLQVIEKFDTDPKTATNQPRIYVYAVQNSKAKSVSDILNHVMLGGAAPVSSASSSTVKSTVGSGTSASGATAPKAGPVTPVRPAGSGSGGGDTLVAATTKIYPDETNNTLVILASPSDYSVILTAIKQIDIVPRQVMIEAVIASLSMTDNLTLGLRWNASFKADAANIKPISTHPLTAALGTVGFQNISGLDANSFGYVLTDKSGNVKVAIEALAEDNKAKILSSPHLLVSDNKEAKIQVGQQVPLATSTTTTPTTSTSTTVVNTTTSTVQYKDVGTILNIKPQINDSGLVSLEITQEVSNAETSKVLGTDQYIINKNEVKTNLVVQDGQTIIIGGLVTETINFARSAIPFFGKLPVVGYLFGHTADKTERRELIIMLTPRVVRNPAEAKKLTSDYSERFKNVEKEIKLEKHFKTFPIKEQPAVNVEQGKPAETGSGVKAVTTPAPAPQQATPAGQVPSAAPAQTQPPVRRHTPGPQNVPVPLPQPAKPAAQPAPKPAAGPAPVPSVAPTPAPKPGPVQAPQTLKPVPQQPAPKPAPSPARPPLPVPPLGLEPVP